MLLTDPPLPPGIWAATPCAARALIVALQAHIRELEARLGQISTNSSRPPPSDSPQAPQRPKTPPSGRKRAGQPGHRGTPAIARVVGGAPPPRSAGPSLRVMAHASADCAWEPSLRRTDCPSARRGLGC